MATRDIASDLSPWLALKATISSDTTTAGTAFDMSNYDPGYMFFIKATAYTDGTYTLNLQDSPDNSVWTAVATVKLILPEDGSAPALTEVTAAGDQLQRIGAFSTNRYVRASVVSTSTTSGASIEVYMAKKGELKPVAAA